MKMLLIAVLLLVGVVQAQAADPKERENQHFKIVSKYPVSIQIGELEEIYQFSSKVLGLTVETQIKIVVLKDEKAVSDKYESLSDENMPEFASSFYYAKKNTIYIAASNISRYILAHEITHGLVTRFFVVEVPMEIQEILAGYVEYQLRKKDKNK